jgi:hypothetical protein
VNEAIIISNFHYWITKNRKAGKNCFEGKTWTYNSMSSLQEIFPYMSTRQIEYALNKLVKKGVLIKANHNKKKYDRTLWYTLSDETEAVLDGNVIDEVEPSTDTISQNCEMTSQECEMTSQNCGIHSTKLLNPFTQIVEPIPYNKPNSNTDDKEANQKIEIPKSADELKALEKSAKEELLRLKKEKKKIEAEIKKEKSDDTWKACMDTWYNFYKDKIGTAPVINQREAKNLKNIVEQLRSRAETQGVVWDKEQASARLLKFFDAAYSKDDWMRANLSTSTCYNQINSIIQIVQNGKKPVTTKKSSSTNAKSSGAISLAERFLGGIGQEEA